MNTHGVRVTISVPHNLSTLIDDIAAREERSRSEVIRDAVRSHFAARAAQDDEPIDMDMLRSRLAELDRSVPYDQIRKSLGLGSASAARKAARPTRKARS